MLGTRPAGQRRRRRAWGAALAGVTALAGIALAAPAVPAAPSPATPAPAAAASADLGPNVLIFTPDMPTAQIQAQVDAIAAQQQSDQFGTQRYTLLFEPGTYGTPDAPLIFDVGYYTEVAGLGTSPGDTVIDGAVDVLNQCDASGCTALDNFWRSISNLTISVAAQSGCQTDTEFWAVSQAAPMRRVQVTGGGTSLMDYCSAGPQYASGGFIADSAFSGAVTNGSQQQFFTRTSSMGSWSNAVWNQVFAGDVGAPAQSFPDPPYTTLATDPVVRDKPYLVGSPGRFAVVVPSPRTDASGTSWQDGPTAGRTIPLANFFIAHPGDSAWSINQALSRGKNLLLTPGVYNIAAPIRITRADTVVLGLGMATLTAQNGTTVIAVDDVPGVDIAGLIVDAGPVNSPVLVRIGTPNGTNGTAADPTALQDVFFRIGGPHVGKATVSLQVNSNHVVLDDIWAWRADHGTGVGWTVNTAANGLVVNGDDVIATGLFVEHYQKYDVVWNGERGETVFFQNEMPYDAPNQAAWQHDGVPGYAAYKVADSVQTHQGWGMGSYIYTNVNPTLHSARGFEVPTTPGVQMHDLLTVSLNQAGTIDHVIDDTGAPVTPTFKGPSTVTSYP